MFNLVRNNNKTWIFESDNYPTPELYPEIAGRSFLASFKTKEDLISNRKLHHTNCKHCDQIFETCYRPPYDKILAETNTCFSCHLWVERAEKFKIDGNIMIVSWEWYTLREEAEHGFFKGFGGRKFIFQIIGGEETRACSNVWYGGEIPEHLRHLFHNNATILADV